MMGPLRFLLALVVLFSHLGWTLFGLNPGVIAVVVFYFIAGHVVQRLLLVGHTQHKTILDFYLDRFWRLAPGYFACLLIAFIIWLAFTPDSYFLTNSPTVSDWASNIIVIPLNFYMFSGVDRFTLLPPAWSLATEIQFYLLAPFLSLLNKKSFTVTYLASFSLWICAQANIINLDYFGYRLLPGVLFIFMTGMLSARGQQKKNRQLKHQIPLILSSVFFLSGYLLILFSNEIHRPHDREVTLGMLLVLMLLVLNNRSLGFGSHQQKSPWQQQLGHYAFGIFLLHFPMLWLHQSLNVGVSEFLTVPVMSTIMAILIYHRIEKPYWQLKRHDWITLGNKQH